MPTNVKPKLVLILKYQLLLSFAGEPTLDQEVVERGAAHVLHHHEHRALMLANLEDGDDIGVRQAGHHLGFATQAVASPRAARCC